MSIEFRGPVPAPTEVEYSATFPTPTRIIVVGGGHAGVGHSLLATNLAVFLAQVGKAVVLMDADGAGANLHVHFKLHAHSTKPLRDPTPAQLRAALVSTDVPGLELLPASSDAPTLTRHARMAKGGRLLTKLRALGVDYVVLDVGPGADIFAIDTLTAADYAILLTVPEPSAIESTYRFLRAAFLRRVAKELGRDRFRKGLLLRALKDIGALPPPLELVRALAKIEKHVADVAWAEAQRVKFHLVVNQLRAREDGDLATALCVLASRHYGVRLEELGTIEADDTVWLTSRKQKPLLQESATSRAARNIERIARRLIMLNTTRREARPVPLPMADAEQSHYAVLGVGRSAGDDDIRRAHKWHKELYANDSLAAGTLLSAAELSRAQSRVDEALDTLVDPLRRRAYDLSMFPDLRPDVGALAASPTREVSMEALSSLARELEREIGPDTEFTGPLLRRVREARGLEVTDIANRTRIAKAHLAAIEEESYEALPPEVYVRGFVGELAKQLGLEPLHVQRTYLRRMREFMGTATRGPAGRI